MKKLNKLIYLIFTAFLFGCTSIDKTKDSSTSTDIYVESQLIEAVKDPDKFKEKVEVAKIEADSLKGTVANTVKNIFVGDKSQDIGDVEKRTLIEIKEAIIRVQTAKEIEIIATKDLTDPKIQTELGVEIEKFNPNDPNLSPKVKERIGELKSKGETIVVFYDKSTGKIFLNETAKETEIRPSIAREWKIREDLKDDINIDKNLNTAELVGTIFEEFSHILDGVSGRQDKEVAKKGEEQGLESLGRPINEYFKDKYSENSKTSRRCIRKTFISNK